MANWTHRRGMQLVLLILAGCQSAPQQTAVNFDPEKRVVRGDSFDDALRAWMKSQHIPGMAVTIVEDGHITRSQGYGLADVDQSVPVQPKTAFVIGSASKIILATGVMMLIEQGKLGLDDPINRYVVTAPRAWKDITIRHLLTHTSGIPDLFNDSIIVNDVNLFGVLVSNRYLDMSGDHTEKSLVNALAQQPLRFAPGTRHAYSNSGYELLAIIIHRITGKPYGLFLHERIFEPLGMTRTGVFGQMSPHTDTAAGYAWRDGRLYREPSIPTIDGQGCGSGGIVTTAEDLAKFDTALWTGQLVSESTLRQMRTADRLGGQEQQLFGFGWMIGKDPSFRSVGLQGRWAAWGGFTSCYIRGLDERVTVIFLTNGADADWSSIPQTVWKTIFGE